MDDLKNYPPYLDYPNPYNPHTNADRFRAMSDKEQQIFVRGFFEIEDFADWLRRPVEGE